MEIAPEAKGGSGLLKVLVLTIMSAVLCPGTLRAEDWVTLYDKDQNAIEVRIVGATDSAVTVERKKDKKAFDIPFARLADDSVAAIKEWASQGEGGGGKGDGGPRKALDIPDDLPKRFYPRSLSEIEDGLAEILAREGKPGFAGNQVEALNLLNAYRFLSGVPAEVKLDGKMVTGATDAANACQGHGSLSHDLGRSTDKCNLYRGQSNITKSVTGYIQDDGANNREKRGHRRWCLNHPMEETGFGESENKGFSALWAMNEGGKEAKKSWAYPGMGLYPLSYMHGNAWSLYLTEAAPAADALNIEVYRLNSRPEKPFRSNDEIEGEALPVSFVYTFENAINFEPTGKTFQEPGIYYVRMKGGGVREEYVVELIDR